MIDVRLEQHGVANQWFLFVDGRCRATLYRHLSNAGRWTLAGPGPSDAVIDAPDLSAAQDAAVIVVRQADAEDARRRKARIDGDDDYWFAD